VALRDGWRETGLTDVIAAHDNGWLAGGAYAVIL